MEGDTNKPLPTAPGNHGIGTGAGTQNALAGDNNTSSGHHLGRDAAAVGGAGALGEHEHNKHSDTTGIPLHEKPKGTDLGDKLHGVERNRGVQGPTGFPHSQGTGSSTTGTTGQHHYGRDATAVGGAAALGEHEHRKHEHENIGSAGYGNQSSGITDSSTGTGRQHHLGRDAAVGAGGVGLAEHEHRQHGGATGSGYDNTSSGLTGSNQGQHSHLGRDAAVGAGGVGLAEHEHRQHGGATGSSYNTSSGLTGSNQGQHSHLGRDAAVGAGGVGLAEHEHRQHGGTTGSGHNTSSGLTGYDNTSSGLTGSNQGQHSHLGRDAAGVGAAGAFGEHEHRKHEGTTGSGYNTSSGLTGYDNTSSGLTGSNQGQHSHLGRDAAGVGAAGAFGEHEHRKHESTTGGNQYGNTSSGLIGSNQGQHSHLGRDAAGVGAAGAFGEHEHRKHENITGGNQYGNTSSGLTGSSQGHHSHLGRDAAGAGGAGAIGEHEYRKHDNASQFPSIQKSSLRQDPQYSGAAYDSSNTGFQTESRTGDRNRLHKDPPSDHPASQAQGGVPASASERQRMVVQGEERLDSDTGVANPHQGGVNAPRNY